MRSLPRTLVDIGYRDADARAPEIEAFLREGLQTSAVRADANGSEASGCVGTEGNGAPDGTYDSFSIV